MSSTTGADSGPRAETGGMSGVIRRFDWSRTSLGSIERWPRRLAALVDTILLGRGRMALLWGPDHLLVYNDRYREIIGDKHPRALGRPAREVFPEIWATIGPVFARVLATGQAEEASEQLLPLDRGAGITDAWFEYTLNPVPLEDGSIGGILVVAVEVTERVLAGRRLRQLNATLERRVRERAGLLTGIAEGTEDMIAAEDPDFRFLFFNDAYRREFVRLWGREIEVGTSMTEAMAPWPDEQEKARALWARALGGESFEVTVEFGPSRQEKQVYDLRFNPLLDADGRVFGAAHILRNVTEQVRLQEALRDGENRLREADRRKDEFLAMLGHELRNPLAAVRSATEVVKLSGSIDGRVRRAIEVLERQTHHMTRLVDGLLEVSRIARGKIELRRRTLDLREILDDALADSESRVRERGLELATDLPAAPLWVEGDRVRLVQVVDNLVSNAIKFTDPPGRVTVSARLGDEGETAVLRVADTGVGMEPETLELVFEAFHQASQDFARTAGGLGLGLALAKGLVELHGGQIEASSGGLGQGAEVCVRLPLASSPAPPADRARGAKPGRCRLLLVEDSRDAAEMLSAVLEMEGHEVTIAGEGRAALEVLRRQAVDVVLCDLGLPGMSGYDVARAVRADPALRGVGLVALTGYAQPSDRRKTAEAGFDEHLVKPVKTSTLARTLERVRSGGARPTEPPG